MERKTRHFLIGLGRAFGGAVIFSLPLLMTMEMWWLGFHMDRLRLALLMILMIPLLIALDRYGGFKRTDTWGEDAADGVIAYGVGIVSAIVGLLLFGVLDLDSTAREAVGMVALQAVPASFGAVLASRQLAKGGGRTDTDSNDEEPTGYWAELLMMAAGALFLAFNVAPTEEMILIAYKMTPWLAVAAVIISLLLMHAFVYAVEFHGSPEPPEHVRTTELVLRFTVVGYAIALLTSAYVLWTFGRFESGTLAVYLTDAVVLAFPASIGAAAARLIL